MKMAENRGEWQEFKVSGKQLLDKVGELVREGNVRRMRIIHEGQVVVEMPLTVAVAGTLIVPQLAALGALAALLTDCTIGIERVPAAPPTGGEGTEQDPPTNN
jgi:hypothetical protein